MSISRFLKRICISIAPVLLQKLRFVRRTGYWPSLDQARTINEIIFSLKINSSESDGVYVDKLLVQSHIKNLIELHGLTLLKLPVILFEKSEIESFLENLPQTTCFLKANHGSGMCVYYDPLKGLDVNDNNFISSWLKMDYGLFSGEKCYSKIDRKLFAEQPILCADGTLPDDIKVHCYYGKPAVIQVLRRSAGKLERETFDEHWESRNWFENEVLKTDLATVPKQEVLEYASIFARPFKYVRVDFYLVDGLLYFSELTLYPASGNLPLVSKEVDSYLGEKFKIFCDV